MQLVILIIIAIIKFIIKIGDAVLFLSDLILKTVKKINHLFILLFKYLAVKIKDLPKKIYLLISFLFSGFLNVVLFIPSKIKAIFIKNAPAYPLFPVEKLKIQKQNRYKARKIRSSVIFPLPFTLKLKYFAYGCIFSFIFVFMPLLALIFLQNLPNPKKMILQQIPQTTKIYDRNNILLYQIYATQNRTIVPLSDIPKNLQDATIAIEDKNFYNHIGFDLLAIIRSAKINISGEGFQGGSTITQQLIKSALLTPETNLSRKIKEVVLAFWAERIYNKNQILEMYFNYVPYGGTAWGVQAASEVYFGKNVKDLDLAESAFLAGIPRAPTSYSPFGTNPTLWKKRQKEVLRRMVELDYITPAQEKEAVKEDLIFQSPQIPIYAPHFVMYIKDVLVRKYGLPMVEKGGLNVVTSLDLKLQDAAQKIVTEEVSNNAFLNLTNGASLITNPANGDILAMVGSKDFSEPKSGNVNLTTALRQPGSSIKVVTYSAALSSGLTAATMLDDSPVTYTSPGAPPYSPVNYDGKFRGRVSLRIALGNSLNIPAVKVLNQIGIPAMVDFAKKMGVKSWGSPNQYGLSITLGAAETQMTDMATVFGTLANQGVRIDLNPVLKLTDSRGTTLEEKRGVIGKRVLDEGVTFIISNILSDNQARAMEFGLNSPLYIPGRTVSVKTGTSDNKRDNWTIGYTPSYLVAVWVGNNDNSPMSQALASGITGAAPIWNKIMTTLLAGTSDVTPAIPINVITKNCIGRTEYFIKGTENSVNCNFVPSVTPTPKP